MEQSKRTISRRKVNAGAGPKTVAVEFTIGEFMDFTYSREDYTPQLERKMNEMVKEGLPGNMLAAMLVKVGIAWNVVDDHPDDLELPESQRREVPMDFTAENLDAMFSIEALSRIVEEIANDSRPNQGKSPGPSDTF